MATSRSLGEFAKRMVILSKRVQGNSVETVRRAAMAADQAVVTLTPYDTGRARSNWIVSIGKPSNHASNTPEKSGSGAIARGASTIAGYKLGAGGIFITNNLPYIGELESGTSMQRPEGMTTGAIQAALRIFKKARLFNGF